MKGFFVLVVLFLTIELGHAAPARPLYESPEQPKLPTVAPVAGSQWFGKCYVNNLWIIFEPNGTLTYGYDMNKWKGGSWKLEGNALYFEMNQKYLEFRGTVTGDMIQGEAWNVQGSRWQTLLARTQQKQSSALDLLPGR